MRRELQVELQAQFRARCEGLKARMEEEKVQAVGEACRKLREQLNKEAEETRETIIQTGREETQVCVSVVLFIIRCLVPTIINQINLQYIVVGSAS